ncbi:hypothetical protein GCM10023328_40680 [Modestobacter marinus]|uniref:Putative membrane protein YphA (DoxX/SURF4 family) n=1 Tax=Modestobacter marinus TaxID=477641 RepID=A0A846LYX4_9ACTN|nr:DoxX family membrane protein [Modestobacter marinus]NIH68629.1 putative membrane protein YphA (DoxX/SURF4 family) [Modestobacter marinus]GGL58805.1 hypothetical protein GCM10011589_13510 [Modestobacter marinus]
MHPTQAPPAERTHWSPPDAAATAPAATPARLVPRAVGQADAVLGGVADACRRRGPMALRWSLAVVFVWFGGLKLAGATPVEGLIAATLPFVSPAVSVPALGLGEVALGVAVALGLAPRLTLLALAAHLTGTFLAFAMAPELMVTDGNPLLLTADGEFVLKNVVLISAALVLVGRYADGARPGGRAVPRA